MIHGWPDSGEMLSPEGLWAGGVPLDSYVLLNGQITYLFFVGENQAKVFLQTFNLEVAGSIPVALAFARPRISSHRVAFLRSR